jgi:hypothetical protein
MLAKQHIAISANQGQDISRSENVESVSAPRGREAACG